MIARLLWRLPLLMLSLATSIASATAEADADIGEARAVSTANGANPDSKEHRREASAQAAAPVRLNSPFGILSTGTVKSPAGGTCPAAPTPHEGPLEFASKYEGSDHARDQLNLDAEARYKQATKSIQTFEAGLSELSDRYVQGQPAAAACALQWMLRWANADALTGPANMTGKAVRKWALAATAFSLLKLRDAPGLPQPDLEQVNEWLERVAALVIGEHQHIPASKLNNHYYWAAAAVGATGIAINDRALFDWSMSAYRRSVSDIDQDGVLPRELARRSRAFSYHLYALQPLVMLAEMGRVNGIDLYGEGDCAVCRLVDRVSSGLADPAFFENLTGARQHLPGADDRHGMVWLPLLAQACPDDTRLHALVVRYQPFRGRRLGGNLTEVFMHTRKERPHAVNTQACNHLWR